MPHQIQKQSFCWQEQVTVLACTVEKFGYLLLQTAKYFLLFALFLCLKIRKEKTRRRKLAGARIFRKRLTRLARSAESVDFPARATHVPRVRMMHQEICNVLRSVFSLDTTVHAATRSCKILPKGQITRKTFVQLFAQRCCAYYHLPVACSGCRKLVASTFQKIKICCVYR